MFSYHFSDGSSFFVMHTFIHLRKTKRAYGKKGEQGDSEQSLHINCLEMKAVGFFQTSGIATCRWWPT